MTTLEFQGDDLRSLFETLVDALEATSREGERPAVVVNGKRYPPYALQKVAALLPDEPLQPHHQIIADQLFQKKQKGYRRTAYNLAHRANQFASDARHLRSRLRRRTALLFPKPLTTSPLGSAYNHDGLGEAGVVGNDLSPAD